MGRDLPSWVKLGKDTLVDVINKFNFSGTNTKVRQLFSVRMFLRYQMHQIPTENDYSNDLNSPKEIL